jgi:hypothetical protein
MMVEAIPKRIEGAFINRGRDQAAEILFYDDRIIVVPLFHMPASHPVVTKYLIRRVLEPNKGKVPYRLNLSDDRLLSFELRNPNEKECESIMLAITWVLKRQHPSMKRF